MPFFLITREQFKLFRRGPRRQGGGRKVLIVAPNPRQGALPLEVFRIDPNRHTGPARGARRGIGNGMGAPEPTARQDFMEVFRPMARQFRHDLTLQPPINVRAGHGGGREEILWPLKRCLIHGGLRPKDVVKDPRYTTIVKNDLTGRNSGLGSGYAFSCLLQETHAHIDG